MKKILIVLALLILLSLASCSGLDWDEFAAGMADCPAYDWGDEFGIE